MIKINKSFTVKLFIFFSIIFSSNASILSSNDIYIVVFGLIITTYFIIKGNSILKEEKPYKILIITTCLIILYFFINQELDIIPWLGFFIKLLIAFLLTQLDKNNFCKYFVDVVYFITIVSFVGYFLQLLIPEFFFNLNNLFGWEFRSNSNSLLFNFTYDHTFRNSGCMWEPGAFSALLVITLLLTQFFINDNSNKIKLVLIIGIITTFSTTGYLALGLIILYSTLIKLKGTIKLIGFTVMMPLLVYIYFSSEILSTKVNDQIFGIEEELDKAHNNQKDYIVGVSRFTSFAIDLPLFFDKPLFGYGIDMYTTKNKDLNKYFGENVIRSSGIMILLLHFGIFGFILYIIFLYRNMYDVVKKHSISLFIAFVILLLIFSNPLSLSPIVLILFFLNGDSNNKKKQTINIKN